MLCSTLMLMMVAHSVPRKGWMFLCMQRHCLKTKNNQTPVNTCMGKSLCLLANVGVWTHNPSHCSIFSHACDYVITHVNNTTSSQVHNMLSSTLHFHWYGLLNHRVLAGMTIDNRATNDVCHSELVTLHPRIRLKSATCCIHDKI